MSCNKETDDQMCHKSKEAGICKALRFLEERVRQLELQVHAAFVKKLSAPKRKHTRPKKSQSTIPTVKRKAKNPVCPDCGVSLDPSTLKDISSAYCHGCNNLFNIV